jgi:hypothetical protein
MQGKAIKAPSTTENKPYPKLIDTVATPDIINTALKKIPIYQISSIIIFRNFLVTFIVITSHLNIFLIIGKLIDIFVYIKRAQVSLCS